MSQWRMRPKASWAIDSESIWARGIIVNYLLFCVFTFSRYHSLWKTPLVSLRIMIFNGVPMLVEYMLKDAVLK